MNHLFHTDSGKGKAVIFLHGFCETHDIWNGFADRFEHNRIITIDLPGFGKSAPLSKGFTLEAVGDRISHLLRDLKITDPVIIGHSLGGYVALAMGAREQYFFSGICLFHSTAYADTMEKKANRNRTIEFVEKNGVPPFVDTFVPGLFYKKDHPATHLVRTIALQTSKETLIEYSRAMRDRPDHIGLLKNFERPFLVIAGENDSIIPIKTLEEQVTFLKKPTFTALRQSGHMGFFEEPEISLKTIEKFINTCSG